ncbi:hypothetical protein CJF32_00004570 [Rutstroemia sp. NJR-2017a WRK4]|nr:hypothetical protein CJF32_00004570 [Rutstroemia sp. NJR-2017a WRK4]
MYFSASIITSLPLFLLSAFAPQASAAPMAIEARATATTYSQAYYLVNCFNNITFDAYAEIDYYTKKSLNTAATPLKTSIINSEDSIDYEDGTWTASSPFTFKAVIGEDAYTATAGSTVGSATASTTTSTLKCLRLTRFVLYEPKVDEQCYTDYACVHSASLTCTYNDKLTSTKDLNEP